MGITRTLVFNDVHIPYHDPENLALLVDIAVDIDVDRVVIAGDLLDFYNVNSYGKHPDVETVLEEEISAGREFLELLRERLPTAEIVFLFGNHEDRLDRYIVDKCPVFWNIIKLEKMLNLKRLNISYEYYNYCYQLEETSLFIQHSPPSYSKSGALTSLELKADRSYIFACTHRRQSAFKTGASGLEYQVYFNGCLCSARLSKEHKRVFSYKKGHENWQQCASIVTVFNRKKFEISQFSLREGTAVVDGALYER